MNEIGNIITNTNIVSSPYSITNHDFNSYNSSSVSGVPTDDEVLCRILNVRTSKSEILEALKQSFPEKFI